MTLRALQIDLGSGVSQIEALPPEVEQRFLGGRGAAAWLIATRVPAMAGPLSPSNLLVFSAGPLTGALPIATGGFVASARSPITGSIAHSWAIGRWGAALRRAGVDLLALAGQSSEWCYIEIDDGQVRVRPAAQLLGLDTYATAQAIRREIGQEYAVVCIGPAGESGVAYSSIVAEGLFPAEPAGTGAVMANKRVKAIAVRGTRRLAPAEAARVEPVVAAITRRVSTSELASGIRQYGGSLFFAATAAERGALTGRNGQDAAPSHLAAIGREPIAQRGKREPRGCEGCPLPCASSYIRKNGEPMAYPELEALAAIGASCGIASPDTLIIANDLCVRLGLDVASTGAALAFMMECQQEGLARGGNLPWGDAEALLAAIRRLGQRQEKRDLLSLGVGEMQDVYYGSAAFAPQVKGLALPALDPRALHTFAIASATAPIGGDFRYAMAYETLLAEPPAFLPDDPSHPQAIRGKVPRLIWHERYAAALDAAGICRRLALMAYQIAPAEVNELLSATLGRPFSGVEVATLGERIVTLERALALHYEADGDGLPRRWAQTPLDAGPAAGQLPPLAEMLAEYYRRHGWDESGVPPAARLADLGIPPMPEE